MKHIKLYILALTVFLSGCVQNTPYTGPSDYLVTVWSGGLPVAEYYVYSSTVVSTKNGYFFFSKDRFIRVSGTITVEEL
jgi:hypothetical protein